MRIVGSAFENVNPVVNFHSKEGILLLLTFVFFGSVLLMISSIHISRIVKSIKIVKVNQYNDQFRKVLNAIIINETYSVNGKKDPSFEFWLSELKGILGSSSFARQILIDDIIAIKKNIVGDTAKALSSVYFNLNLYKTSLKKLNSCRWEVNAKGIRELVELDYKPVIPKLLKLTHSKNRQLKEESLVALIRLENDRPLVYLHRYRGNFSLWMQINIHHHLQSFSPNTLPDFKEWFYHPDQNVRSFSIQMALQFRQISSIPDLANLLTDPDSKIQALAIKALTELQAHSHLNEMVLLSQTTWSDSRLTKQIIKALGMLGDESHIPILSKFLSHPSYFVRFEAVQAWIRIGGTGTEQVEHDPKIKTIISHLSDPLLQ
jgi:HEAT repeat protein